MNKLTAQLICLMVIAVLPTQAKAVDLNAAFPKLYYVNDERREGQDSTSIIGTMGDATGLAWNDFNKSRFSDPKHPSHRVSEEAHRRARSHVYDVAPELEQFNRLERRISEIKELPTPDQAELRARLEDLTARKQQLLDFNPMLGRIDQTYERVRDGFTMSDEAKDLLEHEKQYARKRVRRAGVLKGIFLTSLAWRAVTIGNGHHNGVLPLPKLVAVLATEGPKEVAPLLYMGD